MCQPPEGRVTPVWLVQYTFPWCSALPCRHTLLVERQRVLLAPRAHRDPAWLGQRVASCPFLSRW